MPTNDFLYQSKGTKYNSKFISSTLVPKMYLQLHVLYKGNKSNET